MVDQRYAPLLTDGVNTRLQEVGYCRPFLCRYDAANADRIYMHGLRVGDLFSADEKEVVIWICVQQGGVRECVVIGNGQELIPITLVPGHHIVRWGIAVGIDGMRVQIPAIPSCGSALSNRASSEPETNGTAKSRAHEFAAIVRQDGHSRRLSRSITVEASGPAPHDRRRETTRRHAVEEGGAEVTTTPWRETPVRVIPPEQLGPFLHQLITLIFP